MLIKQNLLNLYHQIKNIFKYLTIHSSLFLFEFKKNI